MPSSISMKELLETGVHFGHRTTKWNPKMRPYIFTEHNGIHIIDLQQTMVFLNQYADMLRDMVEVERTDAEAVIAVGGGGDGGDRFIHRQDIDGDAVDSELACGLRVHVHLVRSS